MKVLITGGTGFVGEEIVRQLHLAGHEVRALVRDTESQSSRKLQCDYGVKVCAGNILDADSLDRFFSKGDAVIHLVGIISEVGKNTFEAIHATGTRNVVTAAKQLGVRRYIQMSALGTRPNATARYHQTKWEAEEAVRKSGLDATIFRPSIIYGRGDKFTTMFAKMARWSPFLPVIGNGQGTMQPLPVQCVAKCFVNALSEPRASDQTIDLVGPEVLTFDQVLDSILSVCRRKRLKVHVPLGVAGPSARVLEKVYGALGKAPPLNRDQITMLQERTVGDGSAMEKILQVSAPGFREGIGYLKRH